MFGRSGQKTFEVFIYGCIAKSKPSHGVLAISQAEASLNAPCWLQYLRRFFHKGSIRALYISGSMSVL